MCLRITKKPSLQTGKLCTNKRRVLGTGDCACLHVWWGTWWLSSAKHFSTCSSASLSKGLVGKIEASLRALRRDHARQGRHERRKGRKGKSLIVISCPISFSFWLHSLPFLPFFLSSAYSSCAVRMTEEHFSWVFVSLGISSWQRCFGHCV